LRYKNVLFTEDLLLLPQYASLFSWLQARQP